MSEEPKTVPYDFFKSMCQDLLELSDELTELEEKINKAAIAWKRLIPIIPINLSSSDPYVDLCDFFEKMDLRQKKKDDN